MTQVKVKNIINNVKYLEKKRIGPGEVLIVKLTDIVKFLVNLGTFIILEEIKPIKKEVKIEKKEAIDKLYGFEEEKPKKIIKHKNKAKTHKKEEDKPDFIEPIMEDKEEEVEESKIYD